MVSSALVTLKTLVLGDLDTSSGWYAKTYVDSTIEAAVIPKSAQQILLGTGLYVKSSALGLSVDPVRDDDVIGNSNGDGFVVTNRQAMWYFDTFMYYFYDLQRLPSGAVNVGVASTTTDPRYRTKLWLDTNILAANLVLDDNTTPATFLVQYANPDYGMERVMMPSPGKDRDIVFSVGELNSTPLPTWNHATYGYNETVPIEIATLSKTGCTGTDLQWQAEQELRRISETYFGGALGVLRRLERKTSETADMGGWPLFKVKYILEYKRSNSNYTPTYPYFGFGTGWNYDGDRLAGGVEGTWVVDKDSVGTSVGVGSTTSVMSSSYVEADDTWNGFYLTFTSGVNVGVTRLVTDFAATGDPVIGTFTTNAFPAVYTAGDTFALSESAGTEQTIDNGDFLALTYTAAEVFTTHHNSLALLSATYKKIRIRYKCGNANVKAKVTVTGSTGTQTVLAATNSTTFTVVEVALVPATVGTTIQTVSLYATTATGTVYYDFVEIYDNNYILPNCTKLSPPQRLRDAWIIINGKISNSAQALGADSVEISMTCDLDCEGTETSTGVTLPTWKRPQLITTKTDQTQLLVFDKIMYEEAKNVPWHWLNWGTGACKVRLTEMTPNFYGDNTLELKWTEYRLSSGSVSHENELSRFSTEQVT